MASDAEKEGKQAKYCGAIWIRHGFDMDSTWIRYGFDIESIQIRIESIRIETNHHSNCFAV